MGHSPENSFVSVVIPVYNRANLITRAMGSVLSQTYSHFELIVVDDASTDETAEVIKGLNDARIRYIRHETNKGGSAARNTGIQAARGKYIALLDSDDEWLPEKLEKQVAKLIASPERVGAVYTARSVISEVTKKLLSQSRPALRGKLSLKLLHSQGGSGIDASNILVKSECVARAGFFDEELPACQEVDFFIRLSKVCEFDFVPEVLAKVYRNAGQISGNLDAKINARKKLLEKYYCDYAEFPSILSERLNRLAQLYCFAGNFPAARRCFLRSIRIKPLQRHAYVNFLRLLFMPQRYCVKIQEKESAAFIDGLPYYY